MKKINIFLAILLVTTVLVISAASFALAEKGKWQGDVQQQQGKGKEKQSMTGNSVGNFMKRFQDVKADKEYKHLLQKRMIAEKKMLKAQDKYMQAKQKFNELNQRYQERFGEFLEYKNRFRECQLNNITDSVYCKNLENQTLEHAREVVIASAERIIQHLEQIKAKVDSSEFIDESTANKTIEQIDSIIDDLKDEITQAENADTKEELKEIAQDVQDIWTNYVQGRDKVYGLALLNARIGNVIERSENLQVRLNNTLNELENDNITISGLQTKIDAFDDKIEDAKDNYNKADQYLEDAFDELSKSSINQTKISEYVKNARTYITTAENDLKEANTILKEIVQMIHDAEEDED